MPRKNQMCNVTLFTIYLSFLQNISPNQHQYILKAKPYSPHPYHTPTVLSVNISLVSVYHYFLTLKILFIFYLCTKILSLLHITDKLHVHPFCKSLTYPIPSACHYKIPSFLHVPDKSLPFCMSLTNPILSACH